MTAGFVAPFAGADPDRPRAPTVIDRVTVAVMVPIALAEGMLREGVSGRSVHVAVVWVVVAALWFRSARPFVAFVVAFGATIALGVFEIVVGREPTDLISHACLLLFPYSLVRWSAGREIALGAILLATTYVVSVLQGEILGSEEAIGAAVVLLFPAIVGASVRFRAEAQRRAVEQAESRERELLARELHDTVAHHVSAIAIQAQAGRAVFATRPEAAIDALVAIEAEASRALSELRTLVRSLRDDEAPDLAPRPGLADLDRLSRALGASPKVSIESAGPFESVTPSVQAAIFRIAQESVTNAIRHAKRPTRVDVRVAIEGGRVRLVVHDDGEAIVDRPRSGFGLIGMAERAALLGGSLRAGPGPEHGWTVDVDLPIGEGSR